MKATFTIEGRLPGLNDFYNEANKHRCRANAMKSKAEEDIGWCIRKYKDFKNKHFTKPVKIHYEWYEPNKKRDLDNISSFGRKCIQDALVRNGILENDGWKNIVGFTDTFYIDKEKPRIVVTIIDSEEDNS